MKIKIIILLAAQLVFAQTTVGLKDVYSSYFKFGSILNGTTVNNTTMKNIVLREFNSITPENELKPDATLVSTNSTNTDVKVQLGNGAKAILKFCEDNNIPVRGHTLVWHSQTPQWFFKDNFQDNGNWVTPTVMDQRMESYIKNMFALIKKDYPNLNLYAYDVVNEAASDDGTPRVAGSNAASGQSMWVQVYGDNSFVEKAFTYARKYAPATTKLFYNDYNEYIPAKRDYIANSIVKPLYDKGILDGMGMQSHLDVRSGNDAWPSASDYGAAITKFKNIGVEIHVTELDATVNNGNASLFPAQATYYKNIMNEILKKGGKSVTAVVVWGIQDNQSWRSDRKPLLFDASGNKKDAYNEIVKLIPESEWGKPASSSSSGGTSSSSRQSSSSSATTVPQVCGEYQTSFCGGLAYGSVPSNSTTIPSTGNCLYIGDFEIIQPALSSTVAINGTENTCGGDWDNCSYNDKPATKDGGYYVYVKTGTINSYQDNGWKGIVAKAKPTCTSSSSTASSSSVRASSSSGGTTFALRNRIPVTYFSVQTLSNKALRIEISSPSVVEIFDLKGNKAESFDIAGTSQNIELSLPNGVYFAKVRGMKSIKFMLK